MVSLVCYLEEKLGVSFLWSILATILFIINKHLFFYINFKKGKVCCHPCLLFIFPSSVVFAEIKNSFSTNQATRERHRETEREERRREK
ncbi:hypothetical protein VNO77_06391 [Canavalia gladiata]|uniref:Uncharacterized protein n=1 Tax=Canavalia gladiata TaxID=3824 RepID=A0AAN9M845_CANGL